MENFLITKKSLSIAVILLLAIVGVALTFGFKTDFLSVINFVGVIMSTKDGQGISSFILFCIISAFLIYKIIVSTKR